MAKMKLKKGDNVIVLAGKDRKKTGKIAAIDHKTGKIQIEGMFEEVKHKKANGPQNPGMLLKQYRFIDASNVQVVHPTKKTQGSRIGMKVDDKGNRTRVYKANNKEIK